MTKYDWDKELLHSFLEDPQVASEFSEAFDFLRKGPKADNVKLSLTDIIYRDYTYLRLNSFCEHPIEEMLLTPSPTFNISKPKKRISISNALEYTNAFYSNLSPIISAPFKDVFAQKEGRLKAYHSVISSRFSGHCNTSCTAEDYLIDFYQTNDIFMNGTITHEFGHLIGFLLRGYENPRYSYHAFSEVESYFPELLFYEYLESHSDLTKDALSVQVTLACLNSQNADTVLNKFDYAYATDDFVKNSQKINILNFKRALNKKYDKDPLGLFFRTLRYSAEEYLPYAYSYLIAIELLYIWHEDPDEACNLYYKIANLPSGSADEKNDTLLDMGIIPSNHYGEYIRSLKKKIDSLKR